MTTVSLPSGVASAFACLLALGAAASPAAAYDSRYPDRPAVVVPPEENLPWFLQMNPRQRGAVTHRVPDPDRRTWVSPEDYYYPGRRRGWYEPGRGGGYERPPAYERRAAIVPTQPGQPRVSIDPAFMPTVVPYEGPHKPGTVIIHTPSRFLYLVEPGGQARRYGIGVGRPGFQWAGTHRVSRKAEWPDWVPPKEMLERQPHLPRFMAGGPDNPLGARALYLGSTLYRIHGSNEPWTIGHAVSSGCIRMRNEDVSDLYGRVKLGTKVVVI